MPIGEYELESGEVLVVKEEGLIDELKEIELGYGEKEMEEEDGDRKEEADVADWKGMEKRIQNLEDAIADLKKDKEPNSEKVEEVDTEEQLKEEVKEVEVNAAEEVKEELSKPAADPIKHSPETGTGERPKGFTFSQNKQQSIKDRIFEKLNN
jgi:peptidoglycan hydrolase CwlO-like protein